MECTPPVRYSADVTRTVRRKNAGKLLVARDGIGLLHGIDKT